MLALTIASVDRELTLDAERERLEFVNRFVRHNLLNSLNVVDARARILDAHVDDEGSEHLETVQSRTADIVSLVETLQDLMGTFVDDDGMREPIAIRSVVDERVSAARCTFPDASFETSYPSESVEVVADDLLPEALDNVLSNAVRHNPSDDPSVTVAVTADASTVTVTVRDDGPGIPADVLPSVFEKGERGFDSPGTGFGLYLVREFVEAYDGSVAVRDNENGATFEIVLPRPD